MPRKRYTHTQRRAYTCMRTWVGGTHTHTEAGRPLLGFTVTCDTILLRFCYLTSRELLGGRGGGRETHSASRLERNARETLLPPPPPPTHPNPHPQNPPEPHTRMHTHPTFTTPVCTTDTKCSLWPPCFSAEPL